VCKNYLDGNMMVGCVEQTVWRLALAAALALLWLCTELTAWRLVHEDLCC